MAVQATGVSFSNPLGHTIPMPRRSLLPGRERASQAFKIV
jgi:hypothetical protein